MNFAHNLPNAQPFSYAQFYHYLLTNLFCVYHDMHVEVRGQFADSALSFRQVGPRN